MIIFQRSLAFPRKPLATIGEKPRFFFKIPQISSIRSSIRPKPSLAKSLGKVWSNFCGGIARQFPPLSTSASCWKNSIGSSGVRDLLGLPKTKPKPGVQSPCGSGKSATPVSGKRK
ncbi:unnamed protein product [Prunus armeniaca]